MFAGISIRFSVQCDFFTFTDRCGQVNMFDMATFVNDKGSVLFYKRILSDDMSNVTEKTYISEGFFYMIRHVTKCWKVVIENYIFLITVFFLHVFCVCDVLFKNRFHLALAQKYLFFGLYSSRSK